MKKIIDVDVRARQGQFDKFKTELLAVGHYSDSSGLDKLCGQLDRALGGSIGRLIELGDFKGKEGTSAIVYSDGRIGARRVLVVGLGEKKKATLNTVRKAAAKAVSKAVELKLKDAAAAIHRSFAGRFDSATMGRVITEGAYSGGYRYDEFVSNSGDGRPDSVRVNLIEPDAGKLKQLSKGVSSGAVIGSSQNYARTLANRPANVINPPELANIAKKLARDSGNLSCTVFDEKQLAAKGMGGILAVGSGSKTGPRLIVLKYSGGVRGSKGSATVALVGKAITFDSGGISIKPAAKMDEMKLDKCGGIAVLGTMMAAAGLKLAVNVYGIIPAAENMPSATSYRPGDIITTYSGKTVEVLSTDAEGRMILCDAISYAVRQNCDIIVDIATLTGACRVALGKYMAGLMSNDEKLTKQLQRAAEESGEMVWPMPSGEQYAEEMKSKIADFKNVGSKYGGACTGAAFLRQFVDGKKWAHLDIAGVEYMEEKPNEPASEGARGFGVRLLTTYLMNIAKR